MMPSSFNNSIWISAYIHALYSVSHMIPIMFQNNSFKCRNLVHSVTQKNHVLLTWSILGLISNKYFYIIKLTLCKTSLFRWWKCDAKLAITEKWSCTVKGIHQSSADCPNFPNSFLDLPIERRSKNILVIIFWNWYYFKWIYSAKK